MSQYSGETREGSSGALGEGGQLRSDMKRLKEDLAMLRSDLADATKSLLRSGKDTAQNATERVREEISAHPGVSVLGAFGLGLGLGFLVAKVMD